MLTWHGRDRLAERSLLSLEEIDGIISRGLAVNLLKEKGSDRVHWLVWSEKDDRGIVVIRDERTKEIVTVLLDSYEGARCVSQDRLDLAKELAGFPAICSLDDVNLPSLQASCPDLLMKVVAIVELYPRGRNFMRDVSIPIGELRNPRNPCFDGEITRRLKERSLDIEIPDGEALVIRQMILRLGANEAVKSFITAKPLRRPT